MATLQDGPIVVSNGTRPLRVTIEPPLPDIAASDDEAALKQEWAECRTTIGRFDSILIDLRKYGFSFVTTLLTASALFGIASASDVKADAVVAALIIIMALNTLLFTVDVYYTSLQSGAVERALDLEARLKSYRITKYLSDNSQRVRTVPVTLFLYLALQVIIIGFAWWIIYGGAIDTAPLKTFHVRVLSFDVTFQLVYLAMSIGSVSWMVVYWLYAFVRTKVLTETRKRHWVQPNTGPFGRQYRDDGKEVADPPSSQ